MRRSSSARSAVLRGILVSTTALMGVASGGTSVRAAVAVPGDGTWIGPPPPPTDYSTPGNWSGGFVPNGTATFTGNGASTGPTITGTSQTVGTILFDPTAPATTLTIDGNATYTVNGAGIVNQSANIQTIQVTAGSLVFTGNSTAGTAALQAAAGTAVDFSGSTGPAGNGQVSAGSIAGAGTFSLGSTQLTVGANNLSTTVTGGVDDGASLIKVGTGTLTLSGINSYGGATFFNGGTISVANNSSLGDPNAELRFNGGTLQMTGNVEATQRLVTLNAGGGTVEVTGANVGTLGGNIGGTGALNKTGTGTLRIAGTDTHSGVTNITAGTLQFGTQNSGSANSAYAVGATGTLDLGGIANITIGSLAGSSGAIVTSFDPNGGGAIRTTFIVGGLNTSTEFAGSIQDGPVTVTVLRKTGTGTLTLSGPNTYTNGTNLLGGVVNVGSAGALGPTGALLFLGGTLQYSAANQTDYSARFDSATPNQSYSVDTNGQNVTYATGLGSPGGTFTKLGAGTLTFTGTNTYDGGTTFAGGAVNVGSPGALGTTGPLSFTGGTLQYSAANQVDYSARFSNAAGQLYSVDTNGQAVTFATGLTSAGGTFTKLGAGTLTFAGANTYTGATTIAAGTLRGGAANRFSAASATTIAAAGTLDGGGFAQAINNVALAGGTLRNVALVGAVTSTGGVIDGLGGTATLTTTGGTTNATGVNTYAGATNVNGGTLSVIGSITASNITVNNGGTLAGTGKIGDPAINAGGTLAPGSAANPTGTLTIVGPLTFAAGSTYQVNLASAANSRTNVVGTTTIGGGTVNVLAGSGTYAPGTRYTLLNATAGVAGRFTNLQTTTNLAFLQPSLSYDATNVFLDLNGATVVTTLPDGTVVTNPVTFPSVAFTPNQRAAAAGAQSLGGGNPIYDAVLSRSAPEARAAFDALSGEAHASAVTATFETARLVREAILGRLGGFGPPTGLGLAGATVPAAFAADLPGRRRPELAPVPFAATDPRVFSLWGQGFGSFGSTGTDGNAAALTRDTGGFILGADATLDGQYRLGVAGGFTDTRFDIRARASTGEVQSGFGALYGAARFGALNVRIGGAFAGNATRTTRNASFPGFSGSLSARYGGDTLQGFGEVGYEVPLGAAVLEPFVGAAAIRIGRDGFTERGGAAALTAPGRGYDVETVTAGLRGRLALTPGSPFSLRGLIGYRHAFGDVVPAALLAFASGGSQFAVAGVPIDRDAVVAEAGVDWKVAPDLTLGLAYAGQAGQRAGDHGVKGNVLYRF